MSDLILFFIRRKNTLELKHQGMEISPSRGYHCQYRYRHFQVRTTLPCWVGCWGGTGSWLSVEMNVISRLLPNSAEAMKITCRCVICYHWRIYILEQNQSCDKLATCYTSPVTREHLPTIPVSALSCFLFPLLECFGFYIVHYYMVHVLHTFDRHLLTVLGHGDVRLILSERVS